MRSLSKKRLFIAILFTGTLIHATDGFTQESDVQYFKDPEIDFWKTTDSKQKANPATTQSEKKTAGAAQKPAPPKSQFQWNKYMNPTNDEFFKEGDYTPPAPFMEIARNPSDENIENWFKYLETKNELLRNLQQHLNDYAGKHTQVGIASYSPTVPKIVDEEITLKAKTRLEPESPIKLDSKNYRMRLYFDSHCPHCQHMLGTVAALMKMGYWVELKQVDKDTSIRSKIPFSVSDATPEELKKYQIESVPVLLVGDLKHGTFSKIQGYHEAREVLAVLKK